MYSSRTLCIVVAVLSALVSMAHCATIKFDQSQTGDYNLQIHLKNIELYAVFDDSAGSSDDDYGDLTDYTDPVENSSKPQTSANISTTYVPSSSTTSAIPSATSSPSPPSSSSSSLLGPYSPSNSEKIVQMVEALIAGNGNNASEQPVELPAVQQASVASSTSLYPAAATVATTAAAAASSSAASTSNTANRKCGPGHIRDPMGRCRLIRKPHLPFLQMIHTPGVIKSFQPQQRTSDDVGTTKD